jgi:hypothetical protein
MFTGSNVFDQGKHGWRSSGDQLRAPERLDWDVDTGAKKSLNIVAGVTRLGA